MLAQKMRIHHSDFGIVFCRKLDYSFQEVDEQVAIALIAKEEFKNNVIFRR
jgi:hypothetical protein